MAVKIDAPPKVHRLKAVKARVGFEKTTIYTLMAKGEFPKSIRLSKRSVGWLESDITDWIQQRANESRKENN